MPTFLDVRSYITFKEGKPYHVHQADETATTRYYGYCNIDGSWIVMQQNTTTGAHRYIFGKSDFPTNWTGRTGLTYDYVYNL